MNILKKWLIRAIPNVKLTRRVPMGGQVRIRARSHKGLLFSNLTDVRHERVIFEYYDQHVHGPMVVFDVGANIGFHSIPLGLRLTAEGGRLFSFEPDADNLALLHESICLNHIGSTITVVEKAVDATTGDAQFYRDTVSGATGTLAPLDGNSWYQQFAGRAPAVVRVPTISLDDFCSQTPGLFPDLIKIDVEGAESNVLRGMPHILAQRRTVIILDGAPVEAVTILRRAEYILYDLEKQMRPLGNDEAAHTILAVPPDAPSCLKP